MWGGKQAKIRSALCRLGKVGKRTMPRQTNVWILSLSRGSVSKAIAPLWVPAAVCAASSISAGFAVNFLSDGKTTWWWLVLVISALGLIAGSVWTYFAEQGRRGKPELQLASVHDHFAATPQQVAFGNDTSISISADHGSVAAWQIGDVRVSGRPGEGQTQEKG
ncbi:Uncharacterised protein [Mycobacteroides abscessus]|uniref:Uncharacterized protein n=1 Tax=Mycobacteroides abscessus subsp. abscessus TaxID=1185650 RepID=A0AB38CY17_9MYCO|nr:hypothetical protein [Mycobacteroides abscessus]SHP28763.1 Uncharacterised protein [Mycobacteroides abscessus subsp. abscessus]MBE5437350.1 hypothetical protein [Mycobacteroides abscessus]MBE5454831.1 hypothetical protein [Mycobacteroides abscessus]MBE5483087.1 hypothetical protein [Mycobacteroides abscessus]